MSKHDADKFRDQEKFDLNYSVREEHFRTTAAVSFFE